MYLRTNQKGFTLMEVMGAVVVLALMIPMFIIFVDGVKMVGMSKTRNQAIGVAQQKMEELEDINWSDANLTPGTYSDTFPVGGRIFNRDWTIVNNPTVDGQTLTDVKRIAVTVSWDSGAHSTSIVTYRYGEM